MDSQPETEFIPEAVGGILRLLDRIDDVDQLTPRQIESIRKVLHLDIDMSVQDMIETGVIPAPDTGNMRERRQRVQTARERRAGSKP